MAKLPTEDKQKELKDKLVHISLQGKFYQDQALFTTVILTVAAVIVGALVLFSLYEFKAEPSTVTFPTFQDQRLFPQEPLENPGMSTPAMLQWVVDAITHSYSFNFVDYRDTFREVRQYYTNVGYQHYLKALKDSNIARTVVAEKFVISATPTSAPIILREKPTPTGAYAWLVKIPILVVYQNSSRQRRQNLIITLSVERVPTTVSERGIAIASFLVSEGKL